MPLSYGINKRKMVQKKTPRSSRQVKQGKDGFDVLCPLIIVTAQKVNPFLL